jgi:glutathione synthase/RimK-type ligase-like ATP-grasp enzyme
VNNPLLVGEATRAAARVALVTCRELPELDGDDQLLFAPLAQRGITAEPAVWDDPAVDWGAYDLVVIRNPWDYFYRRADFVAWASGVRRLANPAAVVSWNTDKRYLAALAASRVPVVPTTWIGSADAFEPPAGEYVIKPAVSAGSKDTGRYDPAHADQARAHVAGLQADDRLVMIQPYLPAVDTYGETALLYFASPETGRMEFSHAIRKGPMLSGPYTGVEGLYAPEAITPRTPTAEELAVAQTALANAPEGLLYARVDVIPGLDGSPVLVELELTEPSVFLAYAPGAADRFAAAIAARAGR